MELLESLKGATIYVLESAACLGAFYLFYHFVLRKENCFRYNRAFLLAAVIFSVVFPLIHVSYNPNTTPTVLNSIHEVSNEPIANNEWMFTITAKSLKPFFFWWEAVALVYALGVIAFGLRLFIQIRGIQEFIWYRRHEMRFNGDHYLIKTGGALPTFSFFRYLFWDEKQTLNESEKRQILRHEKVHIQQKHSVDIMLMEILKAIFWFNPLMYLYKNTFEEVHEYEADNIALRQYGSKAYTQLLIKMVFEKMGFQMGSHFAKNKTLKRVNMIKRDRHIKPIKYLLPIPLVALLFFIFSCEAVHIEHKVEIENIAYQAGFADEDIRPTPVVGFDDWTETISYDIEYATAKQKYGIEGEVIVIFDITEEGELENVKVIESLMRGYDEAVIKSLLESTEWNPGIINGEEVNTKIKMPIRFRKS